MSTCSTVNSVSNISFCSDVILDKKILNVITYTKTLQMILDVLTHRVSSEN